MDGIFSMATYRELLRSTEEYRSPVAPPNLLGNPLNFMGVRIERSTVFPMQLECSTCGGTGEGKTSTYCPKCKGQGQTRYEGMMRNGEQTILLTGPLPKAFHVSFPAGLVPARPLSPGLA